MSHQPHIRVKAMCLFVYNGRVLVSDANFLRAKPGGVTLAEPENFFRVVGGSVEFGESSEDAVRREVQEELSSEVENLERLDVIENRYVYAGRPGHEIAFLFKGTLVRKELYAQETIHIDEVDYESLARWVSIEEILTGNTPLYPKFNWEKIFAME